MNVKVVLLIAKQFFKKTFNSKGLLVLLSIFIAVILYITIDGWQAFEANHHVVEHHQDKARESWENNPDKHPHRMAHFGTFAFRQQHPLSIFDSGIESYTGNSIFLEAHRQNTANFSEASLSTGLVRFGDLNIAMLLQLILPLIIFFIGYSTITSEKENGTLKIFYTQGVQMKKILLGKSLGLFLVSALFFIPGLLALWSISLHNHEVTNTSLITRILLITIFYILFYSILSVVTVIISGKSSSSNKALLSLLGSWLLFFIIIPKTAQVLGNSIYPNPSKIEFRASVEEEVSKQGDSHDPEDPYFNGLRDSILKVHKVTDVKDLPFNYSGFIMSKGEEQTATIYNKEHKKLIDSYKAQNSITGSLVLFNPYLAIKNLSMGLSGTDFNTYVSFLKQTEDYRYSQSQYMNELQMKFISNKAKSSEGKVHVVKKEYWQNAPKFQYEFISVSKTIESQILSLITLCIWLGVSVFIIIKFYHRFKII
ncbi:ABC transporter permease [Tenacibaculum sp. 190524A05c]|uniref:ABC-2 type transport system permease protein n=1 Tax=Tenacibaculum platacis TaxID=3137852 RepID=A0ABP1EPZ9_9FLAO